MVRCRHWRLCIPGEGIKTSEGISILSPGPKDNFSLSNPINSNIGLFSTVTEKSTVDSRRRFRNEIFAGTICLDNTSKCGKGGGGGSKR